MTAFNDYVTVFTAPTKLNITAITEARVQNCSRHKIQVMATTTAVAPTSMAGCVELKPGEGFATNFTLAQLFPGVTTPSHLYAVSPSDTSVVSVSHA